MPHGDSSPMAAAARMWDMGQPAPDAGRRIPANGFAGDAGEASPEVTGALAAYADGGASADVLAVLQDSRLLVPVVAVAGEVEVDDAGLAHDKTSDMATVLLTSREGRLGLLAFTGTQQLRAWNPDGRPVPVSARTAAQAARPGRRGRPRDRRGGAGQVRGDGRRPHRARRRLAPRPGRCPHRLDSARHGMIR